MTGQPLPGSYRPDGNYIHFDAPGGLPTLLARLFDTSDRRPDDLAATTRLMAASWEMYQALLAEEDMILRVQALNAHVKDLDGRGIAPGDDPDPAWRAELHALAAEAKRVTGLRRQALAKAQGRPA